MSEEAVKKWINVQDRLPKKYQSVIMHFKGRMSRITGKVTEGWWNGEHWDSYSILDGRNEKITVIKWMELPSK